MVKTIAVRNRQGSLSAFFCLIVPRTFRGSPNICIYDRKLQKSLDLRGSSMNFTIMLKYQDGVVLRIPAEGNAIRPEKAVLPDGYSLRAEN